MQMPCAKDSSLTEMWPRHKYVLKAISVEANIRAENHCCPQCCVCVTTQSVVYMDGRYQNQL